MYSALFIKKGLGDAISASGDLPILKNKLGDFQALTESLSLILKSAQSEQLLDWRSSGGSSNSTLYIVLYFTAI